MSLRETRLMLYLLLFSAKRGSFSPNRYAKKELNIVKALETEMTLRRVPLR